MGRMEMGKGDRLAIYDTVEKSLPTTKSTRIAERPVHGTWTQMRRSWLAYALLAPIFLSLAVFVYYPPILGLVRSFYDWKPGEKALPFVGIHNFQLIASDPELGRQVSNMTALLVFYALFHVSMPFVMAELIFAVRSTAFKALYRFLIIVPTIVPGIVVVLLWRRIYDPRFGPINVLLEAAGLGALARNWLMDPATALYAIIFVGFPWIFGVSTLIFLGGLGQISSSIIEASAIDGCTRLQRVLRIDLPLVLGQVRLLMILAVLEAIQSFQTILVLTQGGPGYVTLVPALQMYRRAFNTGAFGYASAVGLLLFVITISLTIAINRAVRPTGEMER